MANGRIGDDRVRFCLKCDKNVFNLSAMPREDAERLLVEKSGGELCVLEVNSVPGLTETSLLPMAADAAGMGFDDLVARVVELALSEARAA